MTKNEAASVAQGLDVAEIAKAAWDEAWRIAFSEGMSAGHPLGRSYLDCDTEWADSKVVVRLAQAAPPADDLDRVLEGEFTSADDLIDSLREAAPPAASVQDAGLKAAADFIQRKADDYAREFGSGDMGSLSFGNDAMRDYHWGLLELADEIRALAAPAAPASEAASQPGEMEIASHPRWPVNVTDWQAWISDASQDEYISALLKSLDRAADEATRFYLVRTFMGGWPMCIQANPKAESASQPGEMGAGVPIDVTKVPGYVTPAQSSETAAAHAKLGVPQDPCDCSACVKMRGHLYGDVPAASAQQTASEQVAHELSGISDIMRGSAQQDEREALSEPGNEFYFTGVAAAIHQVSEQDGWRSAVRAACSHLDYPIDAPQRVQDALRALKDSMRTTPPAAEASAQQDERELAPCIGQCGNAVPADGDRICHECTQQVQAGGEDKRYRIGAAWKRGGSAGYTRTSLPENARDGQYQLWAELIQPFAALSREQPQPSNGDREGGA